ncbi:hypothetical protein DI270_010835 [Microbispora triticiradicis]|uniref:Uncharacterized protein n=3 Tax=Microbispora TaxID=2005 RepID=A0ABY3LT26_9ACTN|nr:MULTISPECIES: hypothetical protein [Microbispora]RGA05024.1 hypothetical protein DI270_010835 [Microbispora triticiradicis]TLP58868.1 hypothetical protein FED44_18715 [Microbispora fusca]TYB52119.1 hypothetical protein FXF59_25075 [Microbispora tritici]GLW21580.1 hypothetical protein Mame01_16230 [Microbispora amethystogenes]
MSPGEPGARTGRTGSTGRTVHRIRWVPGTDRLQATCFCGAEREFDDPVVLWDWLLGHPEGHRARPAGAENSPAPAAALV